MFWFRMARKQEQTSCLLVRGCGWGKAMWAQGQQHVRKKEGMILREA